MLCHRLLLLLSFSCKSGAREILRVVLRGCLAHDFLRAVSRTVAQSAGSSVISQASNAIPGASSSSVTLSNGGQITTYLPTSVSSSTSEPDSAPTLTALSPTDKISGITIPTPTSISYSASLAFSTALSPTKDIPKPTLPSEQPTPINPPTAHGPTTSPPGITLPPTSSTALAAVPTALSPKASISSIDLTGLTVSNIAPGGPQGGGGPAPASNPPIGGPVPTQPANTPGSGGSTGGGAGSNNGPANPGQPSSDGPSPNGQGQGQGQGQAPAQGGNAPLPGVTIGGNVAPASISNGIYVVGSQALTPGAAPVTINGQVVSAPANGGLVVGGSQTLNVPAPSGSAGQVIDLGNGRSATAIRGANGAVIIDGTTLSPGASPVTIDGHAVSAGPNGAVAVATGSGTNTGFSTATITNTGSPASGVPSFSSIAGGATRTTGEASRTGSREITSSTGVPSGAATKPVHVRRKGLIGAGAGAVVALLLQ